MVLPLNYTHLFFCSIASLHLASLFLSSFKGSHLSQGPKLAIANGHDTDFVLTATSEVVLLQNSIETFSINSQQSLAGSR
jgi:hypothetical protein